MTTDILIKQLEGFKLSLDFLSHDQLVISFKGGEVYVLFILVDSMMFVKGFHLDQAASSVLTTYIKPAGVVFLLLGKYTSREAGPVGQIRRIEREPPNKKRLYMQGD